MDSSIRPLLSCGSVTISAKFTASAEKELSPDLSSKIDDTPSASEQTAPLASKG